MSIYGNFAFNTLTPVDEVLRGTDIRELVFEPLDGNTGSVLSNQITKAINTHAPDVVLQRLDVNPDIQKSSINVAIVFTVKDSLFKNQKLSLTIIQNGFSIT
jgi:phage baseplate assembly protein W